MTSNNKTGLVKTGLMKTGHVKWFNGIQGHGYIIPDDGGPDVFVRHTNVTGGGLGRGALNEGDLVSFEVAQAPKGPTAISVIIQKKH